MGHWLVPLSPQLQVAEVVGLNVKEGTVSSEELDPEGGGWPRLGAWMSACPLLDAGSPVGGGGGRLGRFPEGGTRAHFRFLITAHLLGIHAWKQMC